MSGEQDHPRLHLITSRQCNNNCLFCLDDREARPQLDWPEAEAQLRVNRHLGSVLFTCGEPTLHQDLIRLIALARELGYGEILLVTNGRRLAYRDYAERLLAAGLTGVTFTIHGPDARTHDRLVRTPGAFEQAWQGLRNLADLRRDGAALRLTTSSVVQKGNLAHLTELLERLCEIAPDTAVLNVVQPLGLAAEHLEAVVVRYEAVTSALRPALLRDAAWPFEVVVEGLPHCVAPDLRRFMGQREQIVMRDQDNQDRQLARHRDQRLGEPCGCCGAAAACGGVFEAYAERYGWDEFAPLDPMED